VSSMLLPWLGGLFRHRMIVCTLGRPCEQGLRLLQEGRWDAGHRGLMSLDAVPHLDDRKACGVVVVEQQLAGPTARGVTNEGNYRAKKVAEGRSPVGVCLELVYTRNGHRRWAWIVKSVARPPNGSRVVGMKRLAIRCTWWQNRPTTLDAVHSRNREGQPPWTILGLICTSARANCAS